MTLPPANWCSCCAMNCAVQRVVNRVCQTCMHSVTEHKANEWRVIYDEVKPALPAWDQSDGVWCEQHQQDATLCPCTVPDELAVIADLKAENTRLHTEYAALRGARAGMDVAMKVIADERDQAMAAQAELAELLSDSRAQNAPLVGQVKLLTERNDLLRVDLQTCQRGNMELVAELKELRAKNERIVAEWNIMNDAQVAMGKAAVAVMLEREGFLPTDAELHLASLLPAGLLPCQPKPEDL